MIDIADGFVVLQSYIDSINLLPAERRWPFFLELFKYRIDGTAPKPQSDLERMALVNIFPVINKSVERYTANKENGAKGGRPRKWIPPEEWMAYYKEHGRKATAEHYGIPEETIKKWISSMGKKGKNQDIDIDKDKDIDIDTDKDIYINIKEKNKKESESPKPLEGGSVPRPGQPGFAFVHNGKSYIINKDGKVAEVGTA